LDAGEDWQLKTTKVPKGQDRLNEQHNIGVSDTAFKVLTDETGGNLFLMEQKDVLQRLVKRQAATRTAEDRWRV